MKKGYIYIISNKNRTVLYTGVTSDIRNRIWRHKEHEGATFAARYNCTDLVYYEEHPDMSIAIQREKQIKNWKREWKDELIKSINPEMKDLSDELW